MKYSFLLILILFSFQLEGQDGPDYGEQYELKSFDNEHELKPYGLKVGIVFIPGYDAGIDLNYTKNKFGAGLIFTANYHFNSEYRNDLINSPVIISPTINYLFYTNQRTNLKGTFGVILNSYSRKDDQLSGSYIYWGNYSSRTARLKNYFQYLLGINQEIILGEKYRGAITLSYGYSFQKTQNGIFVPSDNENALISKYSKTDVNTFFTASFHYRINRNKRKKIGKDSLNLILGSSAQFTSQYKNGTGLLSLGYKRNKCLAQLFFRNSFDLKGDSYLLINNRLTYEIFSSRIINLNAGLGFGFFLSDRKWSYVEYFDEDESRLVYQDVINENSVQKYGEKERSFRLRIVLAPQLNLSPKFYLEHALIFNIQSENSLNHFELRSEPSHGFEIGIGLFYRL